MRKYDEIWRKYEGISKPLYRGELGIASLKRARSELFFEKFQAFQQKGGGKSYADTIPGMAPSTEREGGSPAKKTIKDLTQRAEKQPAHSVRWRHIREPYARRFSRSILRGWFFIPKVSGFCYLFNNFSYVMFLMDIIENYMIAHTINGEHLVFFFKTFAPTILQERCFFVLF